eukprot:2230750-Alexandrium_andersonii.AAC.1
MSASLVGSEMCIRDRGESARDLGDARLVHLARLVRQDQARCLVGDVLLPVGRGTLAEHGLLLAVELAGVELLAIRAL